MMNTVQIVNDRGYKALRNLAASQPTVFMEADEERLRQAMVKEAGTDQVWDRAIPLRCSLAPLNELEQSGPSTDYHYSQIMRQALADISLADAANELFWASINCFTIADYVPRRWATGITSRTKMENFVDSHWLRAGSDGRESNAAARLWWLSEISERVARHSKYSPIEVLDAMANNVNLYHQTLARPYLLANPRVVAAIYETAMDGNEHLYRTDYANPLFKSLNLRAGATALDLMDDDELKAVVREAVPPKKA